ncbi:uncharacterized protein BO95DRAFT_252873 [Aspergillus brunneoviolaceus CBS 621.78]|uniref:Uncharacterized protein n=1 Tax=Aspergillus brunneoviolaceus CBS 621.78 TaxID=1450534 RepID=A0ACD1FYG3_9EURO|nr:hypothetical protein BO95DRAFT_252873 [Aspergillus brunneoviolaceus CBS 621.78]RAH41987.1 hypothetical protein BO95DRAFT_252873 [Aspergillus brunneoviolaceus CBS 621.78]
MLDYYPHYAADLTKQQLKKLIEVLSIDSDQDAAETEYLGQIRSPQVVQQIKEAIRGLPTELRQRSKWVRMLRHDAEAAVLCEVHEELNAYVIGSLFALLQREVTHNLTFLKWYREFSDEAVNNLVDALLAVTGMWWMPEAKDDVAPKGAVCFQENKCEACMLARIVNEPWCLRNLRTALVSRVRTKPEIRIPKLLPFVDAAIGSFAPEGEAAVKAYGGLPCDLGYTSSCLAFKVKAARADALYVAARQLRQANKVMQREQVLNDKLRHRTRSRAADHPYQPEELIFYTDEDLQQADDRSTAHARMAPSPQRRKKSVKQPKPKHARTTRLPHLDSIAEEAGVEDVVVKEATKVQVDYAGTAILVTPSHSKSTADNMVTVRPLNVKKASLGGEENATLIHDEGASPEARMVKAPYSSSSDLEEDRLEHEIQALLLPHLAKGPPVGPRYPSSTGSLTQRRRAEPSDDLEDLDLNSICNEIALQEKALWTPTFVDHIAAQPYHHDEPSSSECSSIHTTTRSAILFFNKSGTSRRG